MTVNGTGRTREWLRSIVSLGARAQHDGVPMADVERQEDTVLRALDLLDRQPGIILADEVGMGKTFEALGVVAALRSEKPDARVLVLTPGPDLNTKWEQEFSRFSDPEHRMYEFGGDVVSATRLADFARLARDGKIVLVPTSAFTSTRRASDQAYLLSLFVHWLRSEGHSVNGRTVTAIVQRFRGDAFERVDVKREQFLGRYAFAEVQPKLAGVFRSVGEESDQSSLFDVYAEGGLEAFADDHRVRRALDLARFRLLRKLLPPWDLIIVDEAHKLKNAATVRSQAVGSLLRQRFDKALFLTATPFQLDVAELTQVFRLFSLARTAPNDLMEQAKELLDDIRQYQEAYTGFEAVWRRLDAVTADRFRERYELDPELSSCPDDAVLDPVAQRLDAVRRLKRERIEPHFRRWMIRSIRRDRRAYRRHLPERRVPRGADALPFLIGERLIAELFRVGDGTHKPAAQVSLVSSYAAARTGALLGTNGRAMTGDAEEYRKLLRRVLRGIDKHGEHPKVAWVVEDALRHAEQGEKTLIFCARLETLSELARDIKNAWLERVILRWKEVFPRIRREQVFDEDENGKRLKGRHTLLQARMHRAQDALYLGLRERHLSGMLHIAELVDANMGLIVENANATLAEQLVGKTSATRPDYRLAKRCIEHTVARLWASRVGGSVSLDAAVLPPALVDAGYVIAGLDLVRDGEDDSEQGDLRPKWRIDEAEVRMVLGGGRDLWARLRPQVETLEPRARVQLVEQVAHFLTFKEVSFIVDLLAEAKRESIITTSVNSRQLLKFLDRFWDTECGGRWLARLSAFVLYFRSRSEGQRRDILEGPIRTGEIVRQTKDGESRERLREAFNTPLYPMVLVANAVMQEGLDLHRNCARIVHHDLEWNPAQLEQRVGRIDRIGSFTAQRLAADPTATLDVLYPLIDRTIDVRMYRRVKSREKWLEFLLGATPTFREDLLEDEDVPELPQGIAQALAIDLGPRPVP